MALSQGLLNAYWNRYNQRKALTGFSPSYQDQRAGMDSYLDYGVALKRQEDEMAMKNRQLSMQEQAQKNADRAATVSGIVQTGGLLATGGLTYKALQNQSANTAMMRQYLLGGAGSGGGQVTPWVGSGLTAPGPLQAPGYLAPTLQTPTTFPAAEAGGAVAPAAGTGSMLAAAAPAIPLAAGQYALGKATQPWMNQHGMRHTNQGWTYGGAPGAFAGASLDVGKGIVSGVHNLIDSIF
jgi:hypothetical protein